MRKYGPDRFVSFKWEVGFLETQGKVLRAEGSTALIEIKRASACSGNCVDCSGCREQTVEVTVYTEFHLEPGDWVVVESERKAVLFGLFILFILPLLLPAAAYLLAMKSGFGVWFAIAGAVAAVALIWLLSKSRRFLERTKPRVISIISGKR